MDTVAAMENAFENAWKAGEIPGVVLLAGDRSSGELVEFLAFTMLIDVHDPLMQFYFEDFRYYRAVGTKNPEGEGIGKDDVMWIASCTKLMTSIAVMQCVERGLLDLDADVTGLLPELKDRQVLVGWEQEEPVLEKRKGVITLR